MAENKTKRNARQVSRLDSSFGKYSPEVVARPVDTYVHHQAVDAGRNYQMLAASLSGIAPAINQFLKSKHDEQVAADEAKGQRFYYEQGEPLSWEDVRKKQDERLKEIGVNTSVRNGYLKARMANEANIFREEMYNAYNSGEAKVELPDGTVIPVAESDDPNVFNLWLNRFTSEYIKNNLGKDADPEYFAKIFVPQLEKNANEIQSIHIHERNNVLAGRAVAENNKRITTSIFKLRTEDGGITDDTEKRKEVLAEIDVAIHDMLKAGVSHEQMNNALKQLFEAIALDPTLSHGEDILLLAQDVIVDGKNSLWDTWGNGAAFTRLFYNIQSNRHFKMQQDKQLKQEEANAAVSSLGKYVFAGQPIPLEVQEAYAAKYGWEALSHAISFCRNVYNGYLPHQDMLGNISPEYSEALYNKQMKKQAQALYTEIMDKWIKGESIDLMSYLKNYPDAWIAMQDSDKKQILSWFGLNIDENQKSLMKDAVEILEKTADEYLASNSYPVNTAGREYLYEAITRKIKEYIVKSVHTPEVLANPEAFLDNISSLASTRAKEIFADEMLKNAIVSGQFPASDLDNPKLWVAQQKQIIAQQQADEAAQAKQRAKQMYYSMYGSLSKDDAEVIQKQLHLTQQPSQNQSNGQPKHIGQLFVGMSPKKEKGQTYGASRDKGTRAHKGIDLTVPENTQLRVPKGIDCPLSVSAVQEKNAGKGGKSVKLTGLRPNNDVISITLRHLNSINVKKGQTLKPGDLIALSGNTGVGSGPHLHIELQVNGEFVDPEKYLFS